MSKIKIIKTLKKLMAHERSARLIGNIAEADNFKQKIEELRAKHNITQEIKLDAATESEAFDDYGGEPVFTPNSKLFRKRRIFWEEALFFNLCVYFDCRPVVFKKNNLKIVVGDKEKRTLVKNSYLHLHAEALRGFGDYLKPIREECSLKEKRRKRTSFLIGFGYILQIRLESYENVTNRLTQIEEQTGIVPARFKESTALIKKESIAIHEKREEVNRELDQLDQFKTLEPKVEEIDDDAASAGYLFGAECSLSDEMELPIRQASEDLSEVERLLRQRYEERVNAMPNRMRTYSNWTTASATATYSGVQMSFIFDESE